MVSSATRFLCCGILLSIFSSATRFLCCGILLSICSSAVLSQQTLRTKLTDGSYLDNPSNIEEGTEVTLECTFDAYSGPIVRTIRLGTSDGTGDDFVHQVFCQQLSLPGGTFSSSLYANNEVANGNLPNYFLNSTLFCDSTSMTATFRVVGGWPSTYVCLAVYFSNENINNSKSVIRTHKVPDEPKLEITSSPTVPFEGDEMEYKCTSSGRPAPKLRLSYNGKVIDTGLVHIPSIDTISEDGAEAISILTWTAIASRAYNKEDLTCQIYDHPYKRSKESSIPMAVYFGPDNSLNNEQTWNMKATDKHVVSCDFDSNGGLTYQWYNSSVSPENLLLESTRNYTLQKSDFPDVTAGKPTSMVLCCFGTNLQNNAVTAQWRVNITITLQDITTTTTTTTTTTQAPDAVTVNPGGSTGGKTGGLAWYIYLIIAVGVIAALAIIVALIVFCRNRVSPANKKKAAIKKESNGYNSSGDNSGAVTNPDIMRSNYRGGDLGSPPLNNSNSDYRYSQHVEDYADAIDDKPRSRKPIAYSMDELNLDAGYPDQSPYIEGGPPAYHPHDPNSLYHRDYMSTPLASQSSYSANYGAPC